jgi:Yip1 domain
MYLWRDFVQLVRHPAVALSHIRHQRRLRDGILAFGLAAGLATLASEIDAFNPSRPSTSLVGISPTAAVIEADFLHWYYGQRFILPLVWLLVIAGFWVAAVVVIHLVVRTLGGRGPLLGYLKLTGYVQLVGLSILPFGLLSTLARVGHQPRAASRLDAIGPLLALGVFVWENVLYVMAASANYGISTERATAAVVGPIGCGLVLLFVLAVAALAIGASQLR